MSKAIFPVLLLGSGVAFTACGLLFTFVYGAEASIVFFALMLVGVVDGIAGLVWAAATILWGASGLDGAMASRRDAAAREADGRPAAERDAAIRATIEREATMARRLLTLTGILSIVFLGLLAAIAFQIPILLAWLRGGALRG